MNTKFVFIFVLIGLYFPTQAQKEKKKTKEDVFASVKSAEAERIFLEGEKNFILEDYTKALFYFQQALEYNSNNATIHYKIAEVYLKGNTADDLQRAAQSIETALKLDPQNKYFYLLATHIYSNQRQFDKAAQTLQTLMKEVSGCEERLYELAGIYLQNNKLDEALKTYNQAEAFFGINEISSLQKQRIFFEKGKIEEALAEGDKLIEAYPDEERFVLAQAEILSQHNQASRGITYLEKFISTHPEAGSAKVLRAGLYHDVGQEKKSRELVVQLFDDADVSITSKVLMLGTYNAALSLNKSKKIVDADLENFTISLFEKLKTIYPADPDVHLVGGDMFLMLEKNQEACREYLNAINSGTVSFEAWQNLLFLETQSSQSDSVIAHAERALEYFPNQAMIYYFNGIAYSRKKNYREAARTLEQAKRLSAGNTNLLSEIYTMLGDAYNASKEFEKSDQAYEEVLALSPNNDYVLNNYSYFLSLRKVNLDKAERMSALLIKNHPTNVSYLDTHAWVLFQAGKYKDARKVMERVIESPSANATHYEHYGDILFQLGKTEDAVVQWQKAKSLNGDNEALNKKISDRKIN
ncbi:MAG: tetratricopeptide repeat protein [Bacteroidetes bacterium]|nr:tetratricopeptide repeat protein [Bacteroidota bacterium]